MNLVTIIEIFFCTIGAIVLANGIGNFLGLIIFETIEFISERIELNRKVKAVKEIVSISIKNKLNWIYQKRRMIIDIENMCRKLEICMEMESLVGGESKEKFGKYKHRIEKLNSIKAKILIISI